jgi:hypothetical protein
MRPTPKRGALLLALLAAGSAQATPGPDSVAVLANAEVPGSVALATNYAAARSVPARQVCALPLPLGPDIDLATFREALETPLRACLDAGGVRDRIEAVVLTRGVPLRVVLPPESGGGRVSLAAALSVWDSVSLADGLPVLGRPAGRLFPCGQAMCFGAVWRNAYAGGAFRPGWTLDAGNVHWAPLLVTALFGRSDDDAAGLLDASVASDGARNGGAEILMMDGADPARGALDGETPAVLASLLERGVPARRVPFDANLTGLTLAGFTTGTAGIGTTIEGNTFAPGALVDNLTSFGAVAENFAPEGESQVSIARWVAQGVTGVHGTTDEPLNNCFPSRRFLVDWADGATLAEALHGNLPFVYWQNLVLGDPMAAPYAVRPVVELEPAPAAGPALWDVAATDAADRGPVSLRIYADGVEVAASAGEGTRLCVAPAEPPVEWLVVAQAAATPVDPWRPKGWTSVVLHIAPAEGCALPDAALPDAGALPADAGVPTPDPDAAPPTPDPDAAESPPDPDAAPPTPDAGSAVVSDASPVGDVARPGAPDPDAAAGGAVQVKSNDAGGGCGVALGATTSRPYALGLLLLSLALRARSRRRPGPARAARSPGVP